MKCMGNIKLYATALLTCLTLTGCMTNNENDFKNSEKYDKAMNTISEEVSKGILEQQTCTQVPNTTGGNLKSPIK